MILTPLGPAFGDLDCLRSAITLVARLAILDFNALLPPQSWRLQGITIAASITGAPHGTRGIPAKLLIWGLWNAIYKFIDAGDWRGVAYQLLWQGKVVGVLGIYDSLGQTEQSSLPSNEDRAFDQLRQHLFPSSLPVLNGSLLAAQAPDTQASPANSELTLEFLRQREPSPGVEVYGYGIYLTMLVVLVNAAPKAAPSTITQPSIYNLPEKSVSIIVKGADSIPKPMTRPPFFTWELLCQAVDDMSGFMMKERYFDTLWAKLKLEGVEIGNIHVRLEGGTPLRQLNSHDALT
ncbi:MAG: hypothetical protein Q9172_004659 [Xanthocarpia lactea]